MATPAPVSVAPDEPERALAMPKSVNHRPAGLSRMLPQCRWMIEPARAEASAPGHDPAGLSTAARGGGSAGHRLPVHVPRSTPARGSPRCGSGRWDGRGARHLAQVNRSRMFAGRRQGEDRWRAALAVSGARPYAAALAFYGMALPNAWRGCQRPAESVMGDNLPWVGAVGKVESRGSKAVTLSAAKGAYPKACPLRCAQGDKRTCR
jgi:hypothetical protein